MTTNRVNRSAVALLLLLLLSGLGAASPAAAQDVRLLSTKVADILAQFPADTYAKRDALADQILALGEPGIAEFTKKLVPMGGDDVAVRWALNAMTVVASKAGEPKRALAEKALVSALGAATDVEVRTFLMSQLRPVARDVAVKAAAPLLADAELVEPTTQLLLVVKSPAARAALVGVLDKATGPAKITVVKALGEMKAAEANDRIARLAADNDVVMRKTALAALARIASAASFSTMTAAAEKVDYRYEPANATGALLEYARQLGAKGDAGTAEKVCRLVMKKADDADRLPTKSGALAVLADVRGPAALPDLLAAVDHADPEYRKAALFRADKIKTPAAVQQWVAKARKVDADRRAEIVTMLGRQGTAAGVTFIRASLGSPDPAVAMAAAEAIALVEHGKANADLLALLKTRTGQDAQKVADILMYTTDEAHLEPIAAALDSLQPTAKAAAVSVIGAKGGKKYAAKVVALTSDANPEIRAAAIGALDGVVGPGDLPQMLKLLDAADAKSAPDLQKAVVAAANQVTPAEARATPLLVAIKTAAHPERIVGVLPEVGGQDALKTLVGLASAPDVRGAAFRALLQWRGPEASERLFAIYKDGDPAFRAQAFQAFVRQLSSSPLPADQKVQQIKDALSVVTSRSEKRMLIRALERTKGMQAFQVVAPFLDDAEMAEDAARAVMGIALPSAGAKDGLGGPAVRTALNKVIQLLTGAEAEYEKENIRGYLRTMPGGGQEEPPTMTAQEKAEGFVQLFNGRNLEGWSGNLVGYKAEDGLMVFDPKAPNRSNIYTAKDYSDFQFRFEFQLVPGANSGVGIRAPREGDAAYVGMEIQVLDDTAPVYATLQPYQYHGSVYGVIPAKRGSLKPVGEWNSEEIWIKGSKIKVTVNGTVIVDGDIAEASKNGTMDHKDHPGLKRTSGAIGFLSHDAVVKFRNIRIKDLK
jgi:HEAT repeat protein